MTQTCVKAHVLSATGHSLDLDVGVAQIVSVVIALIVENVLEDQLAEEHASSRLVLGTAGFR